MNIRRKYCVEGVQRIKKPRQNGAVSFANDETVITTESVVASRRRPLRQNAGLALGLFFISV